MYRGGYTGSEEVRQRKKGRRVTGLLVHGSVGVSDFSRLNCEACARRKGEIKIELLGCIRGRGREEMI